MKYKTHCGKGQTEDTQSMKSTVISTETKQNEETGADSIELFF